MGSAALSKHRELPWASDWSPEARSASSSSLTGKVMSLTGSSLILTGFVLCGLLRIDDPLILFRELLTNLLASKSQFSKGTLKASWIVSLWHLVQKQKMNNE